MFKMANFQFRVNLGLVLWDLSCFAFRIRVIHIPSGYVKITIEHGPVEIVDLSIKHGGSFHRFLLVYQRVFLVIAILLWVHWVSNTHSLIHSLICGNIQLFCYIWLVGGLEHVGFFLYIGNGKSSQLTNTPSFFRGVGWNHQPVGNICFP